MSGEAQEAPWKEWQEAWKAYFETAARVWPQMLHPGELSKQWLNAAAQQWPEMGAAGLPEQWQQMVGEAYAAMQAGNDPEQQFALLKQWYDTTSESWSQAIAEVIGSEQFAEAMSRWLEGYASISALFRRTGEQYFSALRLATRADSARVAALVVQLEEKIDRIEDTLTDIEGGTAPPPAGSALAKLEERIERVERKLDRVLAALEKAEEG